MMTATDEQHVWDRLRQRLANSGEYRAVWKNHHQPFGRSASALEGGVRGDRGTLRGASERAAQCFNLFVGSLVMPLVGCSRGLIGLAESEYQMRVASSAPHKAKSPNPNIIFDWGTLQISCFD